MTWLIADGQDRDAASRRHAARATWGGDNSQGAFGLLDCGRGLLAAVIGLIMVTFFAAFLPADSETANRAKRAEALRQTILLLSVSDHTVCVCWLQGDR